MVRRTILGWSALAALPMSLSAAACGDDNENEGACKNGTPSCAGSTFDEKTCTCGPVVDAGAAVDAAAATSCAMPLAVQDAGANVVACLVARASLECPVAGGGSCGCLSEDPKSCSECGASTTCSNRCEAHEYAMACGGPPRRDGGSYAEAPASCRSVAGFPSGSAIYCCPCL
jgi:hypothetical protein